MPVLRLSEIAASAANFADGDSIVTVQSSATDVRLTRTQLFGFPTLQLGSSDAAAPVAQTLQVQSVVAGTSNTAGVDWTFVGSKGTGTGAGGAIIFNIAPAGTTGTAQNAASELLRLSALSGNNASGLRIGAAVTNTSNNYQPLSISNASDYLVNFTSTGGNVRFYLKTGTSEDVKLLTAEVLTGGVGGSFSGARQISVGSGSANNVRLFYNNTNAILLPAVNTVQAGHTDAAAPVAQTWQHQSVVAGTSNVAGVDWTLIGSKGTGTGKGGNIIFKVAPCSSATGATAQNPTQTGLSITASSVATFTQQPSVVIGSSQLNSSAVEGFLYIPTVNGPPTGAPIDYAGRVPIVFDSSNNKLYIYNSSGATWVGGTVPGAWS